MNSHKQDLQSGQIQSLKVLKVGDKILNTTKRAGAKTQWTRLEGNIVPEVDDPVLDEGRTQNISKSELRTPNSDPRAFRNLLDTRLESWTEHTHITYMIAQTTKHDIMHIHSNR